MPQPVSRTSISARPPFASRVDVDLVLVGRAGLDRGHRVADQLDEDVAEARRVERDRLVERDLAEQPRAFAHARTGRSHRVVDGAPYVDLAAAEHRLRERAKVAHQRADRRRRTYSVKASRSIRAAWAGSSSTTRMRSSSRNISACTRITASGLLTWCAIERRDARARELLGDRRVPPRDDVIGDVAHHDDDASVVERGRRIGDHARYAAQRDERLGSNHRLACIPRSVAEQLAEPAAGRGVDQSLGGGVRVRDLARRVHRDDRVADRVDKHPLILTEGLVHDPARAVAIDGRQRALALLRAAAIVEQERFEVGAQGRVVRVEPGPSACDQPVANRVTQRRHHLIVRDRVGERRAAEVRARRACRQPDRGVRAHEQRTRIVGGTTEVDGVALAFATSIASRNQRS